MFQALARRANYQWWIFGSIAIGSFMTVADHGSVLVALPEIEGHFDSDLPTVQWVVVGYVLAISVLLLPMGRLGDIAGRKQVYITGLIIFTLAAAWAGFSINLPMLITAKVFQGVGSAMIQGTGMAMVVSAFPRSERGKALGSHLSVVGIGAIAGMAVGGLMVSALDNKIWLLERVALVVRVHEQQYSGNRGGHARHLFNLFHDVDGQRCESVGEGNARHVANQDLVSKVG